MKLLALEQSTEIGSVALLDDARVIAERTWTDTRFHSQQVFGILRELLPACGWRAEAIEGLVVGVGPGAYTGLRTALAAAQAWALPDQRPVFGVSSAEVLAWQTADALQAARVAVVGDARRRQFWWRMYRLDGELPTAESDWRLQTPDALAAEPVSDAWAVTADWHRIGPTLRTQAPAGWRLVEERRVPTAATLGRLAALKMQRGLPSEPLEPIYLHPAIGFAEKPIV